MAGKETVPAKLEDRPIEYIPLGETSTIKLTTKMVRAYLTTPTAKGQYPTDGDCIKFLMLCKAQELNPWAGDAFLVGYDTRDGAKFSLITSHQALLKRAEANPQFNGLESGVIVVKENGDEPIFREGDFVMPREHLVGGWAACHRKDRSKRFYDALNLDVYSTGRSRWTKDPAGMIVKCAEASVLRQAFATQSAGLYTQEEMSAVVEPSGPSPRTPGKPTTLEELQEKLDAGKPKEPAEASAGPQDEPLDVFEGDDTSDAGAPEAASGEATEPAGEWPTEFDTDAEPKEATQKTFTE